MIEDKKITSSKNNILSPQKASSSILACSKVISNLVNQVKEQQKEGKFYSKGQKNSEFHFVVMSTMALKYDIEDLHHLYFRFFPSFLAATKKPGPIINH